jgi:cellulose synthase/poly-beta-1,6-N-acetylglucosamine synthase-like glycosyltransferase
VAGAERPDSDGDITVRPVHHAALGTVEGVPVSTACIVVRESGPLRERLGRRAVHAAAEILMAGAAAELGARASFAIDDEGRIFVDLLDEDVVGRLDRVVRRLGAGLVVDGERLRVTPALGVAALGPETRPEEAHERARVAAEAAAADPRIGPRTFVAAPAPPAAVMLPGRRARLPPLGRLLRRHAAALQVIATTVAALGLPFLLYVVVGDLGHDLTEVAYVGVVVALLGTAFLIWIEAWLAIRRLDPPRATGPPPPASAIIAAYLPNEAATIVETVEQFLRQDYAGALQVILAYNSPRRLSVEAALTRIARADPRLVLLRVVGSTSKAQNVNAALRHVTGAFTGVFDADHHPDPGSFDRARDWLASGADVVQGHCLVRNGGASGSASIVAVEFESIYAVAHPGRARLHGWGVFGGSNGFWRTALLQEIGMDGSMLTEDIDSSLRAVRQGAVIVSDPLLISRELATTTWPAFWRQRLRWAQGWHQVSKRHAWGAIADRRLSVRQRLGFVHLLVWREIYPWVSLQMFPIVAYWLWCGRDLDWGVPIWVVTSILTLVTGPFTVVFVWFLGDRSVRRRSWYALYTVTQAVFFMELKNLISRVAQVKDLLGEEEWKVTPRSAPAASAAPPTGEREAA